MTVNERNNSPPWWLVCCAGLVLSGCTTTRTTDTPRTALEQLLISNAVDRAVEKVDFEPLRGHAVFMEEKYLDGLDRNYVAGTVRYKILRGGATLVAKPEDAEIILEVRNGGVGTDRVDRFVGMPKVEMTTVLPVGIPEVKLFSRTTQTGTAKIGLVAYHAKTRALLGDGGMTMARSNDNKAYVLGFGPLSTGTVDNEIAANAGKSDESLPSPARPLVQGWKKLWRGPESSEPVNPIVLDKPKVEPEQKIIPAGAEEPKQKP